MDGEGGISGGKERRMVEVLNLANEVRFSKRSRVLSNALLKGGLLKVRAVCGGSEGGEASSLSTTYRILNLGPESSPIIEDTKNKERTQLSGPTIETINSFLSPSQIQASHLTSLFTNITFSFTSTL